jgi:hypothetical protein
MAIDGFGISAPALTYPGYVFSFVWGLIQHDEESEYHANQASGSRVSAFELKTPATFAETAGQVAIESNNLDSAIARALPLSSVGPRDDH